MSMSRLQRHIFDKKNLGFSSCLWSFLLCHSSHKSLHSQSDLGLTASTLKTIILSPRLQPRDWITSGTSCFGCSLTSSSCTLFEFPTAAWHNSEHFQLTLHSRVVGCRQESSSDVWDCQRKGKSCKFETSSLCLCPQRKPLQSTGPIFCGFKC